MASRLPRSFYRRDPVTVARALLGQKLVRVRKRTRVTGIIVETEAYLGIPDKAAHSHGGRRTQRNQTMWADGGLCYVYFTYGLHHCANVVVDRIGNPVAVLLRALEPVEGIRAMRALRHRESDLCSGPARLCQALAIDRTLDGTDLVKSDSLFIERGPKPTPHRIVNAARIGVDYADEWAARRLRYYVHGNPHVSRL